MSTPVKDKLREIDQALYTVLDNAGLDVRNIVLGEKARGDDPKPPALWVLFDDARIVTSPSINREEWTVPAIIAATYSARDPFQARVGAEDLASDAGDVVLADRTLGGAVKDIIRLAFYRGYRRVESDDNIFGAGVGLDIRFLLRAR